MAEENSCLLIPFKVSLAFHKGIIKIQLKVRTLGVLNIGSYIHLID